MFKSLETMHYRDIVRRALAEDLRSGDLTTEAIVSRKQRGRGELRTKEECVLAGLDVGLEVFHQLDRKSVVVQMKMDSDTCVAGDLLVAVEGAAGALLSAERTALNFIQRLSGIATQASRYVTVAAGRAIILDTRKTTPTFRILEKYAVRAGGAANHRLTLDGGVLIKDNHVRLSGSIAGAISQLRKSVHGLPIEVEAQSLAEVDEALAADADIILIDNLPLEEMERAISRCRGRAKTEVSGGVSLDQIDTIAAFGPTYISVGALTHSAPSIDMSFEVFPLHD